MSHGPLEFVVADAMDFGGHFVHYTVMQVHNYAPISETFTSHLKKLKFSLFSGIFSEVKNI